MNPLVHTRNNKTYTFHLNGEVEETTSAGSSRKGIWRGDLPPGKPNSNRNRFWFQFQGDADWTDVPVQYDFKTDPNPNNWLRNVLEVSIAAADNGGVASAPALYPGRIKADDFHDIEYAVLDTKEDKRATIVVYGELSLAKDNSSLEIKLEGTEQTISIRGTHEDLLGTEPAFSGKQISIEQISNTLNDIFEFHAETRYLLVDTDYTLKAELSFRGQWLFKNGQLLFEASASAGTGGVTANLFVAGSYKAVSGGLAVSYKNGSVDVVAIIRGRLEKSGGNWSLALGYSNNRFELKADLDTKDIPIFNDSSVFSIKGSASLIKDATGLTIGLDLKATATINKRGKLVITTSVKGSSTKGYELQLSGDYTIDKTSISFSASYASTGGTQTMKLSFKYSTANFMAAVEAITGAGGTTITVTVKFRLTIAEDGTWKIGPVPA